jgi:hypothetical protein
MAYKRLVAEDIKCSEMDKIIDLKGDVNELKRAVYGNGKPGLLEDMIHVHEKLDALKGVLTFIKWGTSIFCTIALAWGVIIIADHYTVRDFPDQYATKQYMLQVLNEMQKQTQILENGNLNNKEDIQEIRKDLNENYKFWHDMNVTREDKLDEPIKR